MKFLRFITKKSSDSCTYTTEAIYHSVEEIYAAIATETATATEIETVDSLVKNTSTSPDNL